MNSNPFLSVIVPVYNAERYLKRCVESLINQDCNDFEVILVDDGSSDRSGIICDDFALEYENIIVIHQKNAGASIARKTGIEKAQGKYVTFVDADDDIPVNSISLYINELSSVGGYDIVRGRMLCINESNGSTYMEERSLAHGVIESTEDYLKAMYMGDIPMYLCGGVYRKDLFDPKVFEENAKQGVYFGEDYVTNMIVGLKVKSIKFIEDVTYHYYNIPTSITHSSVISVPYIDKLDKIMETAGVFDVQAVAEKRNLSMCLNYLALFFKPEQKFIIHCYRFVRQFMRDPDNYNELKKRTKADYLRFIGCLPVYYVYTTFYRFLYLWIKQGGKRRRIL